MLKPPFSRPIVPLPSTLPLNESFTTPTTTSIGYTLPATIRRGNTLARRTDDPDAHYVAELLTVRLDEIGSYLWLAGLPSCSRPLHRQQLLGREIVITEDPSEHLIWHETRIFVKPLPILWLLLSYAWLVRHESDFRIAREKGLLPDIINWETWTVLIDDFLEHIDLQSLSGVSFRYHYGELRLSRLNKIHCITRFTWRDFVRGYMTTSTWYQDFFARNFAWLLAVFAVVSVALSAMQVVLVMTRGAIAQMNNRDVMLQRKSCAISQGNPTC
ncbi:hypothetical protein DL98DRAFT_553712 [Cadophora sp. DSE1049]|nr:hypothetical protein DL98DRAFT_553712 [Cadophora sp. DSE1049]